MACGLRGAGMSEEKKEGVEERVEPLPLAQAAKLLLEECRMVLPGIQALFGFQLMGVLQARFGEALGSRAASGR